MDTRELAHRLVEQAKRLTEFARLLSKGRNHGTDKAVRTLLAREATLLRTRATGKGETMATIQFTNVAEFLEELTKDTDLVDRHIVRITRSYRRSGPNGLFLALEVIATAKVGEDVVVLNRPCGQFMQNPNFPHDTHPGQEAAQSAADSAVEALEKGCAELRLETRAGVFKEE